VADGWCWFVLREEYCWLVAGGWFVLREKYCWLVADKPNEQGAIRWLGKVETGTKIEGEEEEDFDYFSYDGRLSARLTLMPMLPSDSNPVAALRMYSDGFCRVLPRPLEPRANAVLRSSIPRGGNGPSI
jgi:hypothetical protein